MSGVGTVVVASAVPTNVNTETAVLVIPFSSGNSSNSSLACPAGVGAVSKNLITASMNITPGAGTTAVVVRCRQGANTVNGTTVGPAHTVTLAAAASGEIELEFTDTGAGFAQPYTITVTQTAGTAAGTVNTIRGYVQDYS